MAVVLVADDEEMVRRLVCSILANAGHRVLQAANGLEAVALFRSNSSTIDLVITDMRMPVMGGAEAVARIREAESSVPIICITGFTNESIPKGAYVVPKPFTAPALRTIVERALAGSKPRSSET
jgi:CheY-like chemotaxis protein